jgi:peptidoglycan/LPS O-acetylase OafA/YrhL
MQAGSKSLFPRMRQFASKQLASHLPLNELDRKDTTILKALAILAIVFHNFFHIAVNVRENEFDFNPDRFGVFLRAVVDPSQTIQALFAFYGHFGVQIFIFLSAYGLAKSHWDDKSSWTSFMWSRAKKLYPMFALAVAFWAVLDAMHNGAFSVIHDGGPGILLMFAGVSTVFPGLGFPPIGPWWFIPFIMQAYALFPFLRGLARRFGWPALAVVSIGCFFFTHAANPVLAHWSVTLAMTPIARMRVFCLGIIAARYPVRISWFVAIPAFAVLIIGSQYHFFAHFISLSAVIAGLWIYSKLRPILRNSHALEKIGEYSLAIFLVNGIVRIPFLYFAHTPALQLTLSIASAAVTIAISAFFHYLLAPAPERVAATRAPQTTPAPSLWPVEPASSGSESI